MVAIIVRSTFNKNKQKNKKERKKKRNSYNWPIGGSIELLVRENNNQKKKGGRSGSLWKDC